MIFIIHCNLIERGFAAEGIKIAHNAPSSSLNWRHWIVTAFALETVSCP